MQLQAKFDMKQLQSSTLRWSKKYGETNKQMVARWAVQTCRELVRETYATGKEKTAPSARQAQMGAMLEDAYNVVLVAQRLRRPNKSRSSFLVTTNNSQFRVPASRVLMSPADVLQWIEIHRTRRNRRTAVLDVRDRKVCSRSVFRNAMKIKNQRAGMAKGGWIGAGRDIARSQQGMSRNHMGQNFFKYAQKHANRGSAQRPRSGMRPFALLRNRVPWVANSRVLPKPRAKLAIRFGLSKTLEYYRKAVRAMERRKR